jgi:hypothetical protein
MRYEEENVIDPEQMAEALMEAMGQSATEESTVLSLTVKKNGEPLKVRVRYLPIGAGGMLGYDHGTPLTPPGTRVVKYDFKKWFKENVQKMNDLSLKNIQIINDLDKNGEPDPSIRVESGEVKFSLIPWGEYARLRDLCFPGAEIVSPDSEVQSNENRGKGGKGVRGRKPDVSCEAVRAT